MMVVTNLRLQFGLCFVYVVADLLYVSDVEVTFALAPLANVGFGFHIDLVLVGRLILVH